MTVLTVLSAVVVIVSLGVTLLNALFAPRLRRADDSASRRSISLLVPARNEEHNLERLLSSLEHASSLTEILVLDDDSSDGTAAVARRAAETDTRIRLLSGKTLPKGWTGKNWACQQLAEEAKGDLLIFCDADVELTADAVEPTRDGLEKHDVLSAMPRQRFAGWFDAAVVPLVTQTLIVALLPLPLVPRVPLAGLSGATGQWLAFRAATYRAIGGHEAVRDRVLEDVEIVRRAKALGFRVALVLGHASLQVRMYRRAGGVVEGFSKNLYPLMGGTLSTSAAAIFGFYLLALHPFVAAATGIWWMLGILVGIRLLEVGMLRGSLRSVVLHLPGALGFLWIAVRSALLTHRGGVLWKDRPIA